MAGAEQIGAVIAAADPVLRAEEVSQFTTGPAERRFGITALDHGVGWVTAQQRLPGTGGTVVAGWLGPLSDFAMGRAVQSALVRDVGIRTASLHLDMSARGGYAGEIVIAKGEVLDVGERSVLAAVRIVGEGGDLVATATGRFLVVAGVIESDADYGGSGLTDRVEFDSLAIHLDVKVFERSEGGIVLAAPAKAWMTNPYGIVHGGIPVALADLGLVGAAGGCAVTLDMSVTFHRPAVIGEDEIFVEGFVERAGTNVVSAGARVFQSSRERPCATATSTLLRL